MKKFFCVLFAVLLSLPFAACGGESGSDTLTLDILAGSGAERTEIGVYRTDVAVVRENASGDSASLTVKTGEGEPIVHSLRVGDFVCVFPPVPKIGYSFSHWLLNGEEAALQADGNLLLELGPQNFLEGVFVKNDYRLGVSSNKKGLSFDSRTYCAGDDVELRPEIPEGYKLLGYRVTGAEAEMDPDGKLAFVMPANDVGVEVQLFQYEEVSVKAEVVGLCFWVASAFAFAAVSIFGRKRGKDKNP